MLRGAPRHATVVISPWGLQTEYPEMHLVRDVAVALNSAVTLDAEIEQHKDVLTSGQASILDKVVKVPEIVTGKSPGPLTQDKDPMKTFEVERLR